jgi:hypothetical protein
MMNFRDKNQALPSSLLVAALLIAIGTVLYITFVPVPTTSTVAATEKKRTDDLRGKTTRAQRNLHEKLTLVGAYTFNGQEQDADSATLALVTKLAANRNLKLVGFRPQRALDAGQLTQLPYLVSVSGKFPDVVAFSYDLEAKGTKLSVNLVQLAASDTSTDDVTANLNVVGYLNQPLASGTQNG